MPARLVDATEAISIGDAADRVTAKIVLNALEHGDIPAEGPRLWGVLREAAMEAKRRGATISVICQGFIVQHHGKAEIVRWDQADVGMLERAIDRVSPPEPEIFP